MADLEDDIIEGSDEEGEAMTAAEVLQRLEEVKWGEIISLVEFLNVSLPLPYLEFVSVDFLIIDYYDLCFHIVDTIFSCAKGVYLRYVLSFDQPAYIF